MDSQILSAVRIFEEIEKLRRSCEGKLSHLARNRKCLECGKDWMPKKFEPCPQCQSKDTRLMKQSRKCRDCGHLSPKKTSTTRCGLCGGYMRVLSDA